MGVPIGMIKVIPGLEHLEKVNIEQLRAVTWGDLERDRDTADAVARAENALLRYYLRRAKGEIKLEVLAAA